MISDIINATIETTFEDELIQDLISIIHHFSMKLYSNRRHQLKKIKNELEKIN
jgi:predicted site-specific integrase-resolvase